ncbi:MAG: alpha/beta hydrolase family protein [Lysobacterales bacterium]
MRSETLQFPGFDGHPLAALLDMPDGAPRAYAVFAHCFTCGKDLPAASRIARTLGERGIAVLRFDFTGLGMSGGEFAATTFQSNVADLIRAAGYLRERQQAPSLLIGHSLGGAAVLAAAGDLPEVRAVATIGAPSEPLHIAHLFADHLHELSDRGEAEVSIGGRKFRIRQQFLDAIAGFSLKDKVRQLHCALLVMHSPLDNVVEIDQARQLYEAARHPKSFVSLDDADHILRKPRDATYVAEVLAAWVERYLAVEG